MQDLRPSASVAALSYDAEDPHSLAAFYAAATGGVLVASGDQAYVRPAESRGLVMSFQPLRGPRPPQNVMHVDLTTSWGLRQPLVEHLLLRGAVHQWDVLDEHPEVQWTTLADPEGYLLCIAEHRPS